MGSRMQASGWHVGLNTELRYRGAEPVVVLFCKHHLKFDANAIATSTIL